MEQRVPIYPSYQFSPLSALYITRVHLPHNKKPAWVHHCALNCILDSDFTHVSAPLLFCPRSHSGHLMTFILWVFLVSSGLWWLICPCFSWPWEYWGVLVRGVLVTILQIVPHFGFLWYFPYNEKELTCPSHDATAGVPIWVIGDQVVGLDRLARVVFARFLHWKVTLFGLLSIFSSWEVNH